MRRGMIGRVVGAMSAEPIGMVTIPRAELDAMKAKRRWLQLAEDRAIALARMKAPKARARRAHLRNPAAACRTRTVASLVERAGIHQQIPRAPWLPNRPHHRLHRPHASDAGG